MNKDINTEIEILRVKDIMENYGLNQDETYALLNAKGCPILPRKPHSPYKITKQAFETWLINR